MRVFPFITPRPPITITLFYSVFTPRTTGVHPISVRLEFARAMSSLHRAGQTVQRKIIAARARDVKTPPVCRALTTVCSRGKALSFSVLPRSLRALVPSYYDRTVRVYTLVNACAAKQIIHTLIQFITTIFHVFVVTP